MKRIVVLLILFTLFSFNTFAQEYTQLSFPEGAKARLGKGTINDIAYSPDGTRFAVGGSAGIWLYNTETRQDVALLTGNKEPITCIAFSPDGNIIAGGGGHSVWLWNTNTGATIRTFTDDSSGSYSVTSIAFSPNGETLAIGGKGYLDMRLWDFTRGDVQILTGNPYSFVVSVAFSPDGRKLACVNYDNTIGLWSVSARSPIQTFVGHKGTVTSAEFGPEGTIATGGPDGTVRLWEHTMWGHRAHKERFLIHTLTGHEEKVTGIAFSPNDRKVVCASSYRPVLLWDFDTGTLIHTLAEKWWDPHLINVVAFSPDGNTIAGGGEDAPIRLWDATTGKDMPPLIHPEHTYYVNSVAFSPDGNTIASGSGDTTIRLWNATTGRYIRTLTGHIGGVASVAFSPDGNTIVSGSLNTILWDVHTGDIIHTLTDGSVSVAFSPDGNTIAGGGHRTIRLWDARTGELIRTLTGNIDGVTSVAFSPYGNMIAGADHSTIRLWDADTGELIHTLTEHTNRINSLTFSRSANMLASASQDTTVRLWNADTGKSIHTITMEAAVKSVAFNSDGNIIAIGSGNSIMLWHANTGQMHPLIEQHRGNILSVAFSPDENTLVSGDSDNTVLLWDATTDGEIRPLTRTGHTQAVGSVLFSPDGNTIASVSTNVALWDARTGEFIRALPIGPAIAFSPDSSILAGEFWLHDNIISLWDARTGTHIRDFTPQQTTYSSYIYGIAFSSDGSTIASASDDGIVRLWDIATGTLIRTLKLGTPIAFSPNGNTIASASEVSILLWDARTGESKRILNHTEHNPLHDNDSINRILFSPDGRFIAGTSTFYTVLWHVATGAHTHPNVGPEAFSPDGSIFVALNFFLLNTRTGDFIRILTGHAPGGRPRSLTFSPNGNTIACLLSQRRILVWDARTGDRLHTFTGHAGVVSSIAFSPNGRTLASGSSDGTVLLWDLSPQIIEDVNGDGVVNIQDLVIVARRLGQTGRNNIADVNRDGVVNIQDLVLVAAAISNVAAAPFVHSQALTMLTATEVKTWLTQAQQMALTTPDYLRGIAVLKQLQAALTPKETVLLENYPNPFNPETWIPYQLAKPADVTLHIYAGDGKLVRTLALGHQAVGKYYQRNRAAYWDGKNEVGESVASGLYFYTLTAGDFSATRKMLILK